MTDSARRQAGAFLCHTGLSISTRATVHAETAQTAQTHTAQHARTYTHRHAHRGAHSERGERKTTAHRAHAESTHAQAQSEAHSAHRQQSADEWGVRTARRIINLTRGRGGVKSYPLSILGICIFNLFSGGARKRAANTNKNFDLISPLLSYVPI